MNRGRVGEEREGKETDRCPLTGATREGSGVAVAVQTGEWGAGRGCRVQGAAMGEWGGVW
jgi:hypothetical protein